MIYRSVSALELGVKSFTQSKIGSDNNLVSGD